MNIVQRLRQRYYQWKYKLGLGILQDTVDQVAMAQDYMYFAYAPDDYSDKAKWDEYVIPYKTHNVYNQGNTGMCVAYASKAIMEQCEIKEHNLYVPMSSGFVYRNRDKSDLSKMLDSNGMFLREAFRHLKDEGIVPEALYSWKGNWRDIPVSERDVPVPVDLFTHADTYKLLKYFRVTEDAEIKQALVTEQTGLAISVPVTKAIYQATKNNGFVPKFDFSVAKQTGQILGYHCMSLIGWKTHEGKQYWVVQNSWGDTGDRGLYYLEIGYPITEAWVLINKENRQPYWRVQVGAFADKENAKYVKAKLHTFGYDTYIVKINELYKVQLGAFGVEENCKGLKTKVDADPRVVQLNLGKAWVLQY